MTEACCPSCGSYDYDWWTEDGTTTILCETCGWSHQDTQ